jgi:hypothetical protein
MTAVKKNRMQSLMLTTITEKLIEVREHKAKHKEETKHDISLHVVTFDLEQILQSPKINVSSLFYKRKLSTYNLSVYSLGDKKCTNFKWLEATAVA